MNEYKKNIELARQCTENSLYYQEKGEITLAIDSLRKAESYLALSNQILIDRDRQIKQNKEMKLKE